LSQWVRFSLKESEMLAAWKLSAVVAAATGSLLIGSAIEAGSKCPGSKSNQVAVNATDREAAGDRQDIVDTAVHAGSFKTLAAALEAAGLVEALKGEGPFTVFAPTDEAFARLPEGTLESLLEPKNKEKLAGILKYHVVAGNVKAADVVKLKHAETLQGQKVKISATDGVKINDAKVVKTDIACTNGVIHVIDTVLLPR